MGGASPESQQRSSHDGLYQELVEAHGGILRADAGDDLGGAVRREGWLAGRTGSLLLTCHAENRR